MTKSQPHKLQTLFTTLRNICQRQWPILSLLLVFTIIGLWLLPHYQYQVNPDGLAYISITEKYATGNLGEALNGYWGPLLSWLATPLWWLGVSPGILFKFLQLTFALGLVGLSYATLRRSMGTVFALLGAAAVGCFGLEWGLAGPITPDVLVCLLTLALFYLMTKPSNGSLLKNYTAIGVVGALLYYAKSAGFYLFVAVWAVWVVYDFLLNFKNKRRRNRQAKQKVWSLVICILLVLPFWLAISVKYQKPTIGTAGSYNFALVGPHSEGHPLLTRLVPPPNATAVTSWEDPSRLKVRPFKPLDSRLELKTFIVNSRSNFVVAARTVALGNYVLAVAILMYLLWRNANKEELRSKLLLATCAVVSMALYVPIFIDLRYMYFAVIAALFALVHVIHKSATAKSFGGGRGLMLLGLVGLGILINQSQPRLVHGLFMDKQIYDDAQTLRPILPKGSRVASDFLDSIYACYYLKAQCYGPITPTSDTAIQQLSDNKIEYLLLTPASAKILQERGVQLELVGSSSYIGRFVYKTSF